MVLNLCKIYRKTIIKNSCLSEAGQGCFGRWRRLLTDHLNCLQGEEEEIEVTPGNTVSSAEQRHLLTCDRPSSHEKCKQWYIVKKNNTTQVGVLMCQQFTPFPERHRFESEARDSTKDKLRIKIYETLNR